MDELTERDRWLMKAAFGAFHEGLDIEGDFAQWLSWPPDRQVSRVDDLLANAPPRKPCPHIVSSDEGTSYCSLNGPWTWTKCADRLPDAGVPVIAYYVNSAGKGRRIRAQYAGPRTLELSSESDPWDNCEYDEEQDIYYCAPGWYETNEHEETHWQVTDEVTHWMPLPEVPNDCYTADRAVS